MAKQSDFVVRNEDILHDIKRFTGKEKELCSIIYTTESGETLKIENIKHASLYYREV